MKSLFDKLVLADVNSGVFDGEWRGGGATIEKISPIDGRRLASVRTASDDDYNKAIARAHEAFSKWRVTPAPVRGETVRRLGNALREMRSEEHTSELQSHSDLVCRLLLEKKKQRKQACREPHRAGP